MIVVRYPWFGLAFMVAFGSMLLSLPFFFDDQLQDHSKALFVETVGFLLVFFGVWKLLGPRIGFVVDRQGIWLPGWNERNLTLVPWDDLSAVRFVRWPDGDSEHEGLLLELRPGAPNPRPLNRPWTSKRLIEREIGPIDGERMLLLSGAWSWSPERIAKRIDRCLKDPRRREGMSIYR